MKNISFIFIVFLTICCKKEVKLPDVTQMIIGNKIGLFKINNKTKVKTYFNSSTETPYIREDDLVDNYGEKHKYLFGTNAIQNKKWAKTYYVSLLRDLIKTKNLSIYDDIYIQCIDSVTSERFVIRQKYVSGGGPEKIVEHSNLMTFPYDKSKDTVTYHFKAVSFDLLNF